MDEAPTQQLCKLLLGAHLSSEKSETGQGTVESGVSRYVFPREKWSLNLREKANNFEIPGGFQISKFKLHLYALGNLLPFIYSLYFSTFCLAKWLLLLLCGANNNKFSLPL